MALYGQDCRSCNDEHTSNSAEPCLHCVNCDKWSPEYWTQMPITEYALSQKRRELMKERMGKAVTDDAIDALEKLTFTDGSAEAFSSLLQSGDACAIGHAVLRAIESAWEKEISIDARISLREAQEAA